MRFDTVSEAGRVQIKYCSNFGSGVVLVTEADSDEFPKLFVGSQYTGAGQMRF